MELSKCALPTDGTVYKPKTPFQASLLSRKALTTDGSPDCIQSLVLDIKGSNLKWIEGQSLGVLAPGEDERGKPHKLRLYSIASSRLGDDGEGETLTLCVKGVVYHDADGNEIRGIASNYLCELPVGEKLNVTGPVGKAFVIPEDPTVDLILIATGTGIAPFRAFLNHIYNERTDWSGRVELFFGVKTESELLYANSACDDLLQLQKKYGFGLHISRSRELFQPDGSKLYVQHLIEQQADTVWDMLTKNGAVYVCGLKGMEQGIHEAFTKIAEEKKAHWADVVTKLRTEGRWNVEVY